MSWSSQHLYKLSYFQVCVFTQQKQNKMFRAFYMACTIPKILKLLRCLRKTKKNMVFLRYQNNFNFVTVEEKRIFIKGWINFPILLQNPRSNSKILGALQNPGSSQPFPFYSTLLYSTQLYSTLLYFTLLCI